LEQIDILGEALIRIRFGFPNFAISLKLELDAT
jgi:hypothetical protein